jgi:predicted nucleic acid-binding protein
MGGLDPMSAVRADVRFESMVEATFVVLLPNVDDFTLAKEFLGKHETGLRAGDALHLAIAKNHGAQTVYSLDKAMIKAGRSLGLPLTAGIRLSS